MNHLMITGNLTRDPETRTVASGSTVCNFTIAVNRRSKRDGQPDADFFRVNAWNKLGDACQKYLSKGKKATVIGSVSVSSYEAKDGSTRSSMDVFAEDVEFLSPREQSSDADESEPANRYDEQTQDESDLPF